MGDFYDHAQAIWSALDAMSEQDPEAYKKFISEQLEQGKAAFGNTAKASNAKDTKETGATCDGRGLESAMRNLNLNSFGMQISGQGQNRSTSSESYGMRMKPKKETGRSDSNTKFGGGPMCSAKPSLEVSQEDEDSEENLLDNEIGRKTSLLARIVKEDQSYHDHNEDEEAVVINELVIPSSISIPSTKRKPLIEEL